MFKISIVGRPNVGKSTLFNRLTGNKHALVDDKPGVTRDRREGVGFLADLKFALVDTAGLEEAGESTLENRMMMQTRNAINESDLCFMVIDGRAGVTSLDSYFANWLRKIHKNIILVVNKCEGYKGDDGVNESYSLGFDNIIPLSAEHNQGMADLYDAVAPFIADYEYEISQLDLEIDKSKEVKHIQVAVVGRPNVGKSTFLNKIYGEDRLLTGPEAGITRDSIALDWEFEGHKLKLIDTAGIRRKSNVQDKLEKLSVADSMRALRFAHIAVLMIDATQPFEKQDLAIAERIIDEGRSVIIALNKWDLVQSKKDYFKELQHKADTLLPQIKGVSMVRISALTGQNLEKVMKTALESYQIWNIRTGTAELNNWLRTVESRHLPPLAKNNRRIKLKYITQGNTRPPTFTVFINRPEDLPESYRRYIINAMRQDFKIHGVPIRVMFRKNENPYDKK